VKPEERNHLEDLDVDGRIILNRSFKNIRWRVDLIDIVQDRDNWQRLVKAVMNIRVPYSARDFLTG